MQQTVLILGGTGKIGSHAADAFWNAGWSVRHYDRSSGDMMEAAKGVDVIVNGLNPPNYHNWAQTIPAITSQVIKAAKAADATVIIPGNIYNYGNQPGELTEDTPHRPNTRKGRVRVEMEETYRASGVQTIVLRAGNFIDPNHNGDIMSLFVMREIAKGKLIHGGDPDAMQAYCYVPDWARAAVMLAEKRAMLSSFEDIPFPGHAFTACQLQAVIEPICQRNIRLAAFPWWLMTILAPFWELAREMREMRYLYEMPHQIGGARLARLLPEFRSSDMDQVMVAGLPPDIHPNQVVGARSQPIVAE